MKSIVKELAMAAGAIVIGLVAYDLFKPVASSLVATITGLFKSK